MAERATPLRSLPSDGDGEIPEDMNVRLAKLETAMKGLGKIQDITVLSVIGVGAILVTVMIYMLTKIDQIDTRLTTLPSQISGDIRDITKTLADVIIATKQVQQSPAPIPAPPVPPQAPPRH